MKTFEECCEYLGIPTDLPKCYVREKQIKAAYKLSVCMEAWNKFDGFKPDETASWGLKNEGYAPYFIIKDSKLLSSGSALYGSIAGLVYAYASSATAYTTANFGMRICLKTQKRAIEFGETFIKTFNELI